MAGKGLNDLVRIPKKENSKTKIEVFKYSFLYTILHNKYTEEIKKIKSLTLHVKTRLNIEENSLYFFLEQ